MYNVLGNVCFLLSTRNSTLILTVNPCQYLYLIHRNIICNLRISQKFQGKRPPCENFVQSRTFLPPPHPRRNPQTTGLYMYVCTCIIPGIAFICCGYVRQHNALISKPNDRSRSHHTFNSNPGYETAYYCACPMLQTRLQAFEF